MHEKHDRAMSPNVNFDGPTIADSAKELRSCSFVFNPWDYIYRRYIKHPDFLFFDGVLSIETFRSIYPKMIRLGDSAVHQQLYNSYTIALRKYIHLNNL